MGARMWPNHLFLYRCYFLYSSNLVASRIGILLRISRSELVSCSMLDGEKLKACRLLARKLVLRIVWGPFHLAMSVNQTCECTGKQPYRFVPTGPLCRMRTSLSLIGPIAISVANPARCCLSFTKIEAESSRFHGGFQFCNHCQF